eukprot:1894734-Rhodomonas_salina.2
MAEHMMHAGLAALAGAGVAAGTEPPRASQITAPSESDCRVTGARRLGPMQQQRQRGRRASAVHPTCICRWGATTWVTVCATWGSRARTGRRAWHSTMSGSGGGDREVARKALAWRGWDE